MNIEEIRKGAPGASIYGRSGLKISYIVKENYGLVAMPTETYCSYWK